MKFLNLVNYFENIGIIFDTNQLLSDTDALKIIHLTYFKNNFNMKQLFNRFSIISQKIRIC